MGQGGGKGPIPLKKAEAGTQGAISALRWPPPHGAPRALLQKGGTEGTQREGGYSLLYILHMCHTHTAPEALARHGKGTLATAGCALLQKGGTEGTQREGRISMRS